MARRYKKALQSLKAPRQESERTMPIKKTQVEGRDAREIAKKLIKSGAIAAIKKAPKREEMSGFKRPAGLERRLERSTISGYQPFSGNNDEPRPKAKKLYDSLMKNMEEDEPIVKPLVQEKPVGGNTVFVQGGDISETMLRKVFSEFGTIININMEVEKRRGFVTFDDAQAAAAAIERLDGKVVHMSQLSVSYARRQLIYNTSAETTKNSKLWASAACRKNEKGAQREQNEREVIKYDNFFD
ncbi:negative elongation factor E-like isoform X2 [Cimex lectularius]|uniref:Negative elongation factor E n=1 Tax=Cimex lectularius TaxID=79782 RepID=A0A8I6TD37_CIMLE|nr:negative elongation factor E-like isoform X2 [Cimex lectularius]